jgi:hypothetical protein
MQAVTDDEPLALRVAEIGRSKSMIRVPLLALAILISGASGMRAQTTVLGVGNRSCGSWTEARRANNNSANIFEGWVAGFLSGSNSITTNSFTIDTLKEPSAQGDAQGLWAWIDNYCQAHPLNSVASAADALGGELIRRAGGAAH